LAKEVENWVAISVSYSVNLWDVKYRGMIEAFRNKSGSLIQRRLENLVDATCMWRGEEGNRKLNSGRGLTFFLSFLRLAGTKTRR
jgi:hypothetical protein